MEDPEEHQLYWDILASSHDALRLIAERLLGAPALRAFRATCKAARDAVDDCITSIRIEFERERTDGVGEEGEEGTAGQHDAGASAKELIGDAAPPAPPPPPPPQDLSCGSWPRTEAVSVCGCQDTAALGELLCAASQRWPRLRELRLISCAIDGSVLRALTTNPLLPYLEELELSECSIDDADVHILANLRTPNLLDLDLNSSGITSLAALHAANWPRLSALSLGGNCHLDAVAAIPFAAAAFHGSLLDLDLSGTTLGCVAMAALVSAPLQSLEWLRIAECSLMDDAIAPLARASWPRLQLLDLSKNDLRSAAAIQALVSARLPHLWSLDLSSNCDLQPSALAVLETASWPCLEHFAAADLQLSSRGALGMVTAYLPKLLSLDLYECTMPWAAVDRLATGQWPMLRRINLGGSGSGVQVRRAGPSLVAANWPSLRTLVLRPTRLTSARAKTAIRKEQLQLRARWPDLRIVYE